MQEIVGLASLCPEAQYLGINNNYGFNVNLCRIKSVGILLITTICTWMHIICIIFNISDTAGIAGQFPFWNLRMKTSSRYYLSVYPKSGGWNIECTALQQQHFLTAHLHKGRLPLTWAHRPNRCSTHSPASPSLWTRSHFNNLHQSRGRVSEAGLERHCSTSKRANTCKNKNTIYDLNKSWTPAWFISWGASDI